MKSEAPRRDRVGAYIALGAVNIFTVLVLTGTAMPPTDGKTSEWFARLVTGLLIWGLGFAAGRAK